MNPISVLAYFLLLMIAGVRTWGVGFKAPVHCSVDNWGAWSQPFFAGTSQRTRNVLRHPNHGGDPCPALTETKNTNVVLTPKQVAKSITTNFLLKSKLVTSRRNPTRQVGKRRDLLLIMDASGSIGPADFKTAKEQIAELLGYMCPTNAPFDNDVHRLAVIRYESNAKEIYDFNDYSTTSSALHVLRNIAYPGGNTDTAAAFTLAKQMLVPAKGARIGDDHVEQEVLILTDGQSNNAQLSIAAANSLKQNATVYGLVIGSFSNSGKNEILQYVSNPADKHLFSLPNFGQLKDLVKHVKASIPTHKCAPFDI